jgi:hypothetical protein
MFREGVCAITIIKKATSLKELLLMKKEILKHGLSSYRTEQHALELINEQIDLLKEEMDVKDMIIEFFQHLL